MSELVSAIAAAAERVSRAAGIDPAARLWGNTAGEYVFALAVFFLALAALKLVQVVVLSQLNRLAQRTKTDLDDTFIKMVRSFNPPFYTFLAFWIALQQLSFEGFALQLVNAVLIIWVVYQSVIALGIFIQDVIFKKFAARADATTQSALRVLANLSKGALWGLGIIVLLSNLGVDVTGLLAGVGIGGIAIAFAVQGILSDLFSSFSIYFDKPYKVGDFIAVGDILGTVEHIGVKSTRLRALSGEQVVLSNQKMTSSDVRNYADMRERRVVFSFGILYETPPEKVAWVAEEVRRIIEGIEGTRFDRAHFKAFGDSSLDFEVVYYVLSGDYARYMDIQQEINLALFKALSCEEVGFAYPTRTVYLKKEA